MPPKAAETRAGEPPTAPSPLSPSPQTALKRPQQRLPPLPKAAVAREAIPTWIYPTITTLVALLIALFGTALMLATEDDVQAAWEYKGNVIRPRFWKGIVLEGLEAMRFYLAGEDRSAGSASEASIPEWSPEAPLGQAPPPDTVEKTRLERKKERRKAVASDPPPPPMPPSPKEEGTGSGPFTCLTLEEYSDRFVASSRQRQQGTRLYRCGTRLVDLRTVGEEDPTRAAACASSSSSLSSSSVHPHLRVVLTAREMVWHAKQRLNLAAEIFPLAYLNDNYCDCLDGTDEMLTGACSMSGPGMPLGLERWRAYVVANAHNLLYEDQLDNSTPVSSDKKAAAAAAAPKVRPLLSPHALGGPVLPFVCPSDPETWLSPTMLGDGIVDCCDGSDESSEVWSALHGPPGEAPGGWEGLRAEGIARWRGRRESAEVFPSNSYEDVVHPYYTSASAVLVDKGYTALYHCPSVHAQRLASAETLLSITRRGHVTMLQRERDGWERLGRAALANQTQMAAQRGNLTRQLEQLRYRFSSMMEQKRTQNPIAAGISVAELQQYEQKAQRLQMLEQELTYLSLIVTQKVFGERYEYYPLFTRALTIDAKSTTNSFATDAAALRREQLQKRMSVSDCVQRQQELSQFERYAAAAQAQGMEIPPRPLPLHVDNVSASVYAVIPARVGLLAQRMRTTEEAEMVARAKGLVGEDEPYVKAAVEAQFDYLVFSPTHMLGHWQPYLVDRNASVMAILDPAGDVDLPRRFSIAPVSRLTRGGGRLQRPTRKEERNRVYTVTEEERGGKAPKKPKTPGSEEEKKEYSIPILYHRNTPNLLATHIFSSGSLRCELSQETYPHQQEEKELFTSLRVAFGCAEEDAILAWARNGKCMHEVLIGTPSACTRWVLKEVEKRVERYRAAVP